MGYLRGGKKRGRFSAGPGNPHMSFEPGKQKKFFSANQLKKYVLALFGAAAAGFGMAFNSAATLGNDPVAVFYDGIRNTANLSPSQLGIATNIINYSLIVIVFLVNRKYINIGTFINTLPMGSFIDLGTLFYNSMKLPHTLPVQILTACMGCFLLYFGISVFISLEVGVDPITGVILTLQEHFQCSYKAVKITCDVITLITGALLGGKFGVVTVASAIVGGPLIELFSHINKKHMLLWLKIT